MAGCLPTRTSVEITMPDGSKGTIPAATPRSAGVMSAHQCEVLEALEQWREHAAVGGPAPTLALAAAAPVDLTPYATRQDVLQLNSRLSKVEQFGPSKAVPALSAPGAAPVNTEAARTMEAAAAVALEASDQVNALNLRMASLEAENLELRNQISDLRETLRGWADIMDQFSGRAAA